MSALDLLETDRLILSGWRADQIDDLVRLHGDPRVSKFLSADGHAWRLEEMEAALDSWIRLFETRRLGKLRVRRKSDNVLVGRCGYGIYKPTGEPELGYSLYPEFWGNGYATEAAAALRDWLFRETDAPQFLGFADVRNMASLKVLTAIGMNKTGIADYEGMTCQFHIYKRPE